LQLFELIAKAAGFYGSAGGVGLRKEEEYNRLAAEVFEADGLIVLVGYGKLGNFIAYFHET
jgi:hypothetical protein